WRCLIASRKGRLASNVPKCVCVDASDAETAIGRAKSRTGRCVVTTNARKCSGAVVAEPRQQAVQFIERGKTDGDFPARAGARAAALVSNLDRRGQHVGELLLETKNVTALLTFCGRYRGVGPLATRRPSRDEAFGLANAEAAGDDLVGVENLLRAVERQEGTRVTHLERAVHEQILYRRGKVQQAQEVRRRTARPADRSRGSFMGHAEFVGEALQAAGLLEWIEILALDVLDQRHRRRGFIGHVANEHRNSLETGHPCGAEASLAGNDLEARQGV